MSAFLAIQIAGCFLIGSFVHLFRYWVCLLIKNITTRDHMKRCRSCKRLFSQDTTFCAEEGAPLEEANPPYISKGTTFDEYTAESLLGRGAMGEVWRCKDHKENRAVAVKLMTSELFDKLTDQKQPVVERFLREARAAQKIKHDHVIKIFNVGALPNKLPYYAMETL
jgi:serine/threonine protein kinase